MTERVTDAHVRLQALDPAQSFLVQAPAGSGKTELLTDRILALLATVNRPEEIVAITFTRKAAAEMHSRVLSKLRDGLAEDEPDQAHKHNSWLLARKALDRDREKGWNLLQYPARLSIRTIDAFCAHLVRAMPWLSTLGGMPAITDDASAHYQAAARATLDLAEVGNAVAHLIAHLDVDLRAAESLIARMLSTRDQWLPLYQSDTDAGLLEQHLRETIEEDLERLAGQMPPAWAAQLAPKLLPAITFLQAEGKAGGEQVLADWNGTAFSASFDDLPRWQALADLLLTHGGGLRKRVDKRQGFPPGSTTKDDFTEWLKANDGDHDWIALLDRVRAAPVSGYQPEQLDVLDTLLQVMRLAYAQLMLQFAQAGEVDFIEISMRADQALGQSDDPSELLLSLDASIRHMLVDEFQDTSEAQIRLLQKLTSGWEPGDGRTLFLVGDPMQSIYRFRKAEVGWFLRVQQEGLGPVALTPLQLTTNFRSQNAVVEWVNAVFHPLFPARPDVALGAIPYTASTAFHPQVEGQGVHWHPFWTPADADEAMRQSVRGQVQQTVVSLARQALERDADEPNPVAILVRARSHLQDVVRQLTVQGVPCRAVELVTLKSRPLVNDLVQLARALTHPGDRLAWLSVLRSPLCGLRLATLHTLFGIDRRAVPDVLASVQDAATLEQKIDDADERQRVRHAAAVLLDRGNVSGVLTFATWLERCWIRLGGARVYSSASDQADAQSVFRLVESLAPYGDLDPDALDVRLDRLYAAPDSVTGGVVEVMTIHKSKGMQFNTVILMGLHRASQGDDAPLLRVEQSEGRLLLGPIRPRASDTVDPVAQYLADREKLRAAHEMDRLLYVAATRAHDDLHLIAEFGLDEKGQVKEPAGQSLLARLWAHAPGRPCPPQEPLPAPEADIRPYLDNTGNSPASIAWRRLSLSALPQPVGAAVSPLSPTDWVWSGQHSVEAIVGTVAHAWLEHLGKLGVGAWTRLDDATRQGLIARQLIRAGLDEAEVDAATATVSDAIQATIDSERGRWLLEVARAYREWSLLDMSGRVSVIDLAISDDQGWLVVDYKTGVPNDGESAQSFTERMRSRYGEQMHRYRDHVAALDGRPVRAALYFPRADIWIEE